MISNSHPSNPTKNKNKNKTKPRYRKHKQSLKNQKKTVTLAKRKSNVRTIQLKGRQCWRVQGKYCKHLQRRHRLVQRKMQLKPMDSLKKMKKNWDLTFWVFEFRLEARTREWVYEKVKNFVQRKKEEEERNPWRVSFLERERERGERERGSV